MFSGRPRLRKSEINQRLLTGTETVAAKASSSLVPTHVGNVKDILGLELYWDTQRVEAKSTSYQPNWMLHLECGDKAP